MRLASLEALPVRGDYLGPQPYDQGKFAYISLCQLIQEEDNTKRPALRFDPYGNSGEKEVSPSLMYLLIILIINTSKQPTIRGYFRVSTGKFSPVHHLSPSHNYDQNLGLEVWHLCAATTVTWTIIRTLLG